VIEVSAGGLLRAPLRASSLSVSQRETLCGRQRERDGLDPEQRVRPSVVTLAAVLRGRDLVARVEQHWLLRGVEGRLRLAVVPDVGRLDPSGGVLLPQHACLDELAVEPEFLERLHADRELPGIEVGRVDRRPGR